MKKIILLFLCSFSTSLFAQNWNTIVNNDTTYFAVQAPSVDSMWQGYLRCIYNDSSVSLGGTTTNYFYPSVRLDANNIIDTAHGDTWLGKRNIRYTSGDEFYFNKQGDTILIKTLANVSDTWIMLHDSNNIDYRATLISADTMTIDGIIDSIKTIQLQAFNGLTPVLSVYNSLPIAFSKNHGFYEVVELYGFPYFTTDTIADISPVPFVEYPFPILPFIHQRIDWTNFSPPTSSDLLWKYKPGNEWIIAGKANQNFTHSSSYIHDSIINSNLFSTDSIQVLHQVHTVIYEQISASGPDSVTHTIQTQLDTFFYQSNPNILPSSKIVEHKKLLTEGGYGWVSPASKGFLWRFIGTYCNNKIAYRDTSLTQSLVSGNGVQGVTSFEGFIKIHDYHYINTTTSFFEFSERIIYYKIDSCEYGQPIALYGMNTPSLMTYKSNLSISPNPSSQYVTIHFNESVNISKIIVFDLQGKKILEQKHLPLNKQIDISSLRNGLYFIEIKTDKGTIAKKIVKQ